MVRSLSLVAIPLFAAALSLALAPGCAAKSDTIQGSGGQGTGAGHVGAGAGSTGPGSGGGGSSSHGSGAGGGSGVVCQAAGTFCGDHGAAGGDPGTLYVCPAAGAHPASSSACSSGCQANTPPPDACKTEGCSGNAICCTAAGLYCGGDQIGGDSGTLYTCPGAGLQPSSSQVCANGCKVNPPNTGDVCKAAALTCAGAGDYCGGDQMGGDSNTLYHCAAAGQAPSSSTPCANGCDVKPPNQSDVCNPGLSCPGGGAYCGSDGVQGGDASTLYQCPGAGQPPSSSQVCSGGCSVQPQNTPDYCTTAGTCPTGGDYCGGDGVSGPSNVLYHCNAGGQAPVSSTTCTAGCVVEQQNVADYCAPSGMGGCSNVAQAALNWEANQLNSGNPWSDYCLAFVYNAFVNAGDTIGYLQKPTAAASLAAAQATGQFVGWNGSCPCGAILYWAANQCNGEDGHIVICNGDGTVSTSGWPGYNGSPSASISWLDGQECGNTPSGYILP